MSATRAEWTFLFYIGAHNNLDALGERSLEQILGAGSTPPVHLAVLYDGTSRAARYIAGEPGKPAIEEPLGEFDSGDPARLLESARWAFEQCPAERYGLVLWSHGTGWRPEEIQEIARQARGDAQVTGTESVERSTAPGSLALFRTTLAHIVEPNSPTERAILFDDGTGHSLDTLQLGEVAAEIESFLGQPLDLLGMDACLMATLEVAYQVRTHVHCLVASEELVPGFSWPYDQILGALHAAPEQSAAELAASVVRLYTEYYRAHPPAAGDVTKVALDLRQVAPLVDAVDGLAGALLADMDNDADALWQAQLACYQQESRRGKREPNKFRYHLWDIGSLAAGLMATEASVTVREAAHAVGAALQPGGPTVLAEGHHGDWFEGISGVSMYLTPPKKQRISPYYGDLALTRATRWGEMITSYHETYA